MLAFSNLHAIREGVLRGRSSKLIETDRWDLIKHEYAVAVTEGSEDGQIDHYSKAWCSD
jgi:hypothetical protein